MNDPPDPRTDFRIDVEKQARLPQHYSAPYRGFRLFLYLLVPVFILCSWFAMRFWQSNRPTRSETEASQQIDVPDGTPSGPARPIPAPIVPENQSANAKNLAEGSKSLVLPQDQTPTPEVLDQEYFAATTDLRTLWRNRQLERANLELKRIQRFARTATAQVHYAGLEVLHHYLTEFWEGFENGLKRMEPNQELVVKGNRVLCRGITATEISFRSQGRNLTVQRDKLSPELTIAIADLWFDPQSPAVPLAKAAYWTVSAKREPAEFEHWCAAAKALGAADDVEKLVLIWQGMGR